MRLSDDDAALFYKLMWALQHYANQQLKILPSVAGPDEYAKRVSQEDKLKVRSAMWEHPELLDAFLAANPAKLSVDELAIVESWKNRVAGQFFLERFLKKGAVFLTEGKPDRAYLVLAIYSPFEEMLPPYGPPYYLKTVLLPFRGRIIYDGLIEPYSIVLGGGIRASLRESYMRAKQKGLIIDSLEPGAERATPSRRRSAKPAPDLRPDLEAIVAAADRLKAPAGEPMQGPALALLKAAAHLAQAAVLNPNDLAALEKPAHDVERALKRLGTALERAEWV